ncbi:SHOCT domain-containing protein [Halolamina salifodinae]|uniref:SHOCT domain-containing protein n=1 Tax=Halolamina salifodinae TaxID=1202767 RepID=A0A8T4H3F9_9EURY|nr:SHOCT domain-containing protein [Halolamina salifodinae]MBP1988384.1 hypothetical protein [Halolamina salifodinae]
MYELVHRYAPSSVRVRTVLAALLSVVAVLGAVGTSIAGTPPSAVLAVLVAVGAAALAVTLGNGLVKQAEAAPREANPARRRRTTEAEADTAPVETLQQRYAEGELTDEEFEERMDRLLDSGARPSRTAESDGNQESAFER